MTQMFRQNLEAIQGKPEPFSREFLQWLRTLVDQSNHALTFAAVKAALAAADSSVGFNDQDLTDIDSITLNAGSLANPALVIGTNAAMYQTPNVLYWVIGGTERMRLNNGNLFVYAALGITNGNTYLYSDASGRLKLSNAADSDFNILQFGGDTASFPALKKSGAALETRLADDSAYAVHRVATPVGVNDAVTKAYADALGGGGGTITQVEVDLGSTPVRSGRFTITDAAITATDRIIATQAGGPYTGKGTLGDEAEMDAVNVAVTPATGTATAYWNSRTAVRGNFKFNYMRAA